MVVVELVLLPLQLLFHTQPQRPAQGALKSRTQFLIGSPAFFINSCLRQRCGATQFINKLHEEHPFVCQRHRGNSQIEEEANNIFAVIAVSCGKLL